MGLSMTLRIGESAIVTLDDERQVKVTVVKSHGRNKLAVEIEAPRDLLITRQVPEERSS